MTRARDDRKRNARRTAAWRPPCPNCGQQGPHYVPPSLGEPGFFACPEVSS